MFRLISAVLGVFGKVALTLYFLLAVLILGFRYWALPQLDRWRPQIEQQLSRALELDVDLGAVRGQWKGLRPTLELNNVVLSDADGRQLLALAKVKAVLSWSSILEGVPQFAAIDAYGAHLDLRRDEQGRIWVLGRPFDLASGSDETSSARGALDWLARQPSISVHDTTLQWTDLQRAAPPLTLKDVTLVIASDTKAHSFSLSAIPPQSLGASLDIRGNFTPDKDNDRVHFTPDHGYGQLYARVDDMRSRGWAPWVDLPDDLQSGRVSAQGWLDVLNGRVGRFTTDISVARGRWAYGDDLHVHADQLRLFSAGPWAAYENLGSQHVSSPAKVRDEAGTDNHSIDYQLSASDMQLEADEFFAAPLRLDRLAAEGSVQGHGASELQVTASRLVLRNAHLEGSLQGSWKKEPGSRYGSIDLKGDFKKAMISAVDDYLPKVIDEDVREWIAQGLLDGELTDATLVLRGNLADFPFVDDPSRGEFSVRGPYRGAVIDYLPAEKGQLGWPRLEAMKGHLSIDRATLDIVADEARMSLQPDKTIHLKAIRARIPDLEHESLLHIQGETHAAGSAYLALMTQSPLGDFLGQILNEAKTEGQWEVPLELTIPLARGEDTSVKGSVRFLDNRLSLMSGMPPFTDLSGELHFTEDSVSAEELKGRLLGGGVRISGGTGPQMKGLVLQGQAAASVLADYLGLEGLKRLSGNLPYTAVLHREKSKAITVHAQSDLKGLSIRLPAPVGKDAAAIMPLNVEWRHLPEGAGAGLNLYLGKEIFLRMAGGRRGKADAYFDAGALGIGKKPELPKAGMVVDVAYPVVNVDEWQSIAGEFMERSPSAALEVGTAMLPPLAELRLQAEQARFQGLSFDKLAFTARQSEAAEWRVDISSSQTAGTLFWRQSKGRIAGRVDAKFDRLALGTDPAEQRSDENPPVDEEPFADELDIPEINLVVNKLRLYGREVGALSVVGVNQARGRLWKLDKLTLTSPSAVLSGSGLWRLNGPERGLSLNAEARIKNLGAYLDQIGFANVMKDGAGTVRATIEWRNMPWTFSKADLNGRIELAVEKGRFITLNSYSARLLELLSLQSLKRLARLDVNPAGLGKEGFPFDSLRGTLSLDHGMLKTSDYRVVGPAGTIVLGGDVNLVNDELDLHAVVIPNLDVSGAAIAAGIALNPIVGVGAFLAQWLLQAPLAKAMTAEYRITGNWDKPHISEIPISHEEKRDKAPVVTP